MSKLQTPSICAKKLSTSEKSTLTTVNYKSILDATISSLHHKLARLYQGPVKHKHNQHKTNKPANFNLFDLSCGVLLVALTNFVFLPPALCMPLVNLPRGQSLDGRLNTIGAALDQERYQDTIDSANALIDQHRLNEDSLGYAYCLRGIARSYLNQFGEAVEDIDRGLRINPNIDGKEDLYGIRAASLYKIGRFKEAISSINQSLSIAPSGMGLRLRGMSFFRLSNIAFARRDLLQALTYPDCPDDTRKLLSQIESEFKSGRPHLQRSNHRPHKKTPSIRTPVRSSSEFVCHVNIPAKSQ